MEASARRARLRAAALAALVGQVPRRSTAPRQWSRRRGANPIRPLPTAPADSVIVSVSYRGGWCPCVAPAPPEAMLRTLPGAQNSTSAPRAPSKRPMATSAQRTQRRPPGRAAPRHLQGVARAYSSHVVPPMRIEVRHHQAGDGTGQFRAQRRPKMRPAINCHPLIPHDAEDIHFAIAIETPKPGQRPGGLRALSA